MKNTKYVKKTDKTDRSKVEYERYFYPNYGAIGGADDERDLTQPPILPSFEKDITTYGIHDPRTPDSLI